MFPFDDVIMDWQRDVTAVGKVDMHDSGFQLYNLIWLQMLQN